jgi:mRNA interferase MazF
MTFRRGDVLLVRFPNSDRLTYRKRPALVVQADDPFPGADRRLVACITSNLSRFGQTRIPIEKNSAAGRNMGLLMDSVIVVDDLATIYDDEVDKVMGRCPVMAKVDDALKVLFGLH